MFKRIWKKIILDGFWNNKALNSLQWLGNNSDDDCNIISVHFRVSKWWIATLEKVFDGDLCERKQIGLNIQMFWIGNENKYMYIFMGFQKNLKRKPRDLNSGIEI